MTLIDAARAAEKALEDACSCDVMVGWTCDVHPALANLRGAIRREEERGVVPTSVWWECPKDFSIVKKWDGEEHEPTCICRTNKRAHRMMLRATARGPMTPQGARP